MFNQHSRHTYCNIFSNIYIYDKLEKKPQNCLYYIRIIFVSLSLQVTTWKLYLH